MLELLPVRIGPVMTGTISMVVIRKRRKRKKECGYRRLKFVLDDALGADPALNLGN